MKYKINTMYITTNGSWMIVDDITKDRLYPIVGRLFMDGGWSIAMWHGDGRWTNTPSHGLDGLDILHEMDTGDCNAS